MLQVAIEQLFDVCSVQATPHLCGRSGDDAFGCGQVFGLRRAVGDVMQYGSAPRAPHFRQEIVLPGLQDFCQGQIKPAAGTRSGVHGDTEACAASLTAVDGDNKGGFTPRGISRIDVRTAQKDPVLDSHGVEFTGPHAKERIRGYLVVCVNDLETVGLPLGLP
jgi:hypothetical protein